jgi:hydrogenase nickel incorporation protein HypA/HybF
MHEAAVTEALLGQVVAEAEKHGAKNVSRVRVLLGEGGSVVPECVQFYFDEMKKGTAASGAELEFRRVPVRIRCPKCGAEFGGVEDMCACNAGGEVVSGQELVLESIDIE